MHEWGWGIGVVSMPPYKPTWLHTSTSYTNTHSPRDPLSTYKQLAKGDLIKENFDTCTCIWRGTALCEGSVWHSYVYLCSKKLRTYSRPNFGACNHSINSAYSLIYCIDMVACHILLYYSTTIDRLQVHNMGEREHFITWSWKTKQRRNWEAWGGLVLYTQHTLYTDHMLWMACSVQVRKICELPIHV